MKNINKNLKILQMMDEPWDSGLTASALRLSSMLSKTGQDTTILAPFDSFAHKQALRSGLPVITYRAPWLLSLPLIIEDINRLGINMLHAHTGSMHTLAWIASYFIENARIIRTRGEQRSSKTNPLYSLILGRTDWLVFPTEHLQRMFLADNMSWKKIAKVIYPGFSNPASANGAPSPDSSRIIVTMVGRLDPIKGPWDFLDAAALTASKFPKAEFYMAGEEKNVKKSDLIAYSKKLKLKNKVTITGYLSANDLNDLMARTDIAVIASQGSEVISRVCLEWMSMGKPIVATRVGMITEILEHGVNAFLANTNSPQEVYEHISALAKSSSRRKAVGQKARQTYMQSYSPEIFTANYKELYAHSSS
ncbi:glycosyltransferase family 4 protein [Elusimicrobiota bacterium]